MPDPPPAPVIPERVPVAEVIARLAADHMDGWFTVTLQRDGTLRLLAAEYGPDLPGWIARLEGQARCMEAQSWRVRTLIDRWTRDYMLDVDPEDPAMCGDLGLEAYYPAAILFYRRPGRPAWTAPAAAA